MTEPRRTAADLSRRLSRHSGVVVGLALAIATTACATEPSSPEIPGAEVVSAPAEYRTWWSATEQCSGLSGNYTKLEFYQVPGVSTFSSPVGTVVGLWNRSGIANRITIAGNYLDNELVVRHEMLHALLKQNGHPAEYFVNRCALTWESWAHRNGQTSGAPVIDGQD